MGQFVKLVNYDKLETFRANVPATFTNTSGSSYTKSSGGSSSLWSAYAAPYYVNQFGVTYTTAGVYNLMPYASSDSSIPYSQTSITNQVGSCSISFTKNGNDTGWIANITITGTEDATVNSLLFTKLLHLSNSAEYECLLFAYILDFPIELNADNNYTANLTMAIAFTE